MTINSGSRGTFSMSEIIPRLKEQLDNKKLRFTKKPILIGGMAMEYYGMRKAGADIDLVVSDEDYRSLARKYPENIKDIHGDFGVILEPFEIWRGIMLLDYNFYLKGAIDEGVVYIVSLDRLLLTRVFAMDVPKYMKDLGLIKDYYLKTYTKNTERRVTVTNVSWFISYNLKKDASIEDFLLASEKCHNEVLSKQKGFISWEVLRSGDTWVDLVKWETAEDAKNGETAGANNPISHEFYSYINMSSCKLQLYSVEKDHRLL